MTKPVIGFVGTGKLGTVLAVATASRGFKVLGYDINMENMRKRIWPHKELGPDGKDDFQKYFDEADLTFLPLKELCQQADIVFVLVQTPHLPQYEGITRIPYARSDFDYKWLKDACIQVAKYRKPEQVIVVSSTVLPKTIRREIIPLIPDVCYSPCFPAMGTLMRDFLHPEFMMLSSDYHERAIKLEGFYRELLTRQTSPGVYYCPPIRRVSIESAELAKMYHNVFISAKVTLANSMMEIAHKIPGCNCDEVTDIISLSKGKIAGPLYMKGGLGFSGCCFPRDCIAMSWLAERLLTSCDIFGSLAQAREHQTEWLAHLFDTYGKNLPKVILGKSYKGECSITAGSCSVLIGNILSEWDVDFEYYDPYVDPSEASFDVKFGSKPHCFLVGTAHVVFKSYTFPKGSIVIDPFRFLLPQDGVKIISVGIGR